MTIITVDGPAGSGKSTLGRALARRLALALLDTGLLYRGVMVAAVRAGLDGSSPSSLVSLARAAHLELGTDPRQDEEWLRVDGRDAGPLMRDPRQARLLALISSTPEVRAVLLPQQRRLAALGAVAVGRDCGTVVFPDAPVKFYLDAPEEVRSTRRAAQLTAGGAGTDGQGIAAEVAERDRLDSGRAVSPLRPAADAHVIDTSLLGIDEMIEAALEICAGHGLTGLPLR